MQITTIGIDLAKNVFQVHGANEHGKPVLRKQLKRDQVILFFSNPSPCLIGMEACGGSHHWARKLEALGHTVVLLWHLHSYSRTRYSHRPVDIEGISLVRRSRRKAVRPLHQGTGMRLGFDATTPKSGCSRS
jgi:transposase